MRRGNPGSGRRGEQDMEKAREMQFPLLHLGLYSNTN